MARSAQPGPSRTLADQLRSWPDERLAALLHARPDLTAPTPQDSAQVASRAATTASIQRALDDLDRLALLVLDALVVVGPCPAEEVLEVVHADGDRVREALTALVDRALVWESPGGLRVLTGVGEALRGSAAVGPSGLRPVLPHGLAREEAAARVQACSPAARALLTHLSDHGGEGTTGSARVPATPEEATTPVEEVLARGLVLPQGGGVVHLPGQVGLALRGGRTTLEPVDGTAPLACVERDQSLVDRTAAGAAFDAVRRVELLLDHWGAAPPTVLRNGGLGVKDLRAAATELHVGPREAGLLIEVAAAAGLLAEGPDADGVPAWLPTHAFDAWSAKEPADRWLALVRSWWDSPRLAGLVDSRDEAGRTRNALSPELSSTFQAEARRMALAALAETRSGEALAPGTGVPSVVARVVWRRPRRPASRREMVGFALEEAAALGVTGLGGLATYARQLLAGDVDAGLSTLTPLLPEPVDHVLVQADLTAVAPGPLLPEVAASLHLLADVESRGGATVYRFTTSSVRRALDAGWSAQEVHDFLARTSRTPVPQPLTYLVDDVVRTFGTLRVGHAESFVRADDAAALDELLHSSGSAQLGLRRIAPTVLVSTVPVDVLLPRLRELGAAPVVEAPDGTVHVARPDQQRARTPRPRPVPGLESARESARVASVVTAVRAGDLAAAQAPARSPGTGNPAAALAALREAIESRATVLIDYVDNHGTRTERVVDPLRLEGGQLTAHDHRSDEARAFAVHRISGVRPLGPPA